MQVASLSYHAASGDISVGLDDGQVELWQYLSETEIHKVRLPSHTWAHGRMVAALVQAGVLGASYANYAEVDDGLRQRSSRETELKRSISELEAKCAHFWHLISY